MTITGWRKSSHSDSSTCLEAASWRKPPARGSNEYAEAASGQGAVLVRDTTQDGAGPVLAFGAASWQAFASSLKQA